MKTYKTLIGTTVTKDELMKETSLINLASITGISETEISRIHSRLRSNDEATQENLVKEIVEVLEELSSVEE